MQSATRAHMDPNHSDKQSSELATKMEEIGRFINQELDVFHIESTVNNNMFSKPLSFLAKNEDELTATEEKSPAGIGENIEVAPAEWTPSYL